MTTDTPHDAYLSALPADQRTLLADLRRQLHALLPQADEVKAAFLAQGLTHAGDETIGEWIRIEFERR